jgi:thiol-disulfide isomerase/thioredoxin
MRVPGTRGWIVAGGLAVGLLAAGPVAAQFVALAPGDPAPALSGVTYPVQRIVSADWSQSRLTLVNFFATWCEPCRVEMPLLEETFLRNKDRGFQVVGVFERQEVDVIGEYMADVAVTYPIIRPDAIVDHYWGGISIKPTSFLVDSHGRIVRKYVGATPEQTSGLVEDITAYLDNQPMPTQVIPAVPALPAEVKEQLEQDRRARERKAR